MPIETFDFDKPCSLQTKTRELLKRDKRSTAQIHVATGLPFYWLQDFESGRANGGSVNRVQFLYEFLSGRKLKL